VGSGKNQLFSENNQSNMTPVRIQRKRTKGWRMPENTVYVGRPTPFGNPFHVGLYRNFTAADAVASFEKGLEMDFRLVDKIKKELKGKNLSCFCPLDKPCHADVLLKIANQ
jgi:hypothetical protein